MHRLKKKNGTPYTPSLLSFVYPLPFALLALFHFFAGAPPRNPLGQTVFLFFFFSPFSTRKSLSRGFSPVFHRRRSPFLLEPKCCALPPRLVVDFQLKPEIRSNIRSRPRGEQFDAWEPSVRFDCFREFFLLRSAYTKGGADKRRVGETVILKATVFVLETFETSHMFCILPLNTICCKLIS